MLGLNGVAILISKILAPSCSAAAKAASTWSARVVKSECKSLRRSKCITAWHRLAAIAPGGKAATQTIPLGLRRPPDRGAGMCRIDTNRCGTAGRRRLFQYLRAVASPVPRDLLRQRFVVRGPEDAGGPRKGLDEVYRCRTVNDFTPAREVGRETTSYRRGDADELRVHESSRCDPISKMRKECPSAHNDQR
jgi:hypothetical protein